MYNVCFIVITEKFYFSKKTKIILIQNSFFLNNLPLGSIIHNISLYDHGKGQLVRSAGTYAQLIKKNKISVNESTPRY